MEKTTLVGLDCGKTHSGVVVLTGGVIREGQNLPNELIVDFIMNEKSLCSNLTVVIEDVRPYNMRITDGLIDTIKFIGWIEGKLKELGVYYKSIPRWKVKEWVFNTYHDTIEPEVIKKIEYAKIVKARKGLPVNENKMRPTFVYVDDRMVTKVMKMYWNIPTPKVGQRGMYGLKDHSYQALGVTTVYIVLYKPFAPLILDSV